MAPLAMQLASLQRVFYQPSLQDAQKRPESFVKPVRKFEIRCLNLEVEHLILHPKSI